MIINKLQRYKQVGYMDSFEIGEIIEDIKEAYSDENTTRVTKMMEDVTQYMVNLNKQNDVFEQLVRNNIEATAKILNRTPRTIYRRLQQGNFTLVEKQKIMKELQKNVDDG